MFDWVINEGSDCVNSVVQPNATRKTIYINSKSQCKAYKLEALKLKRSAMRSPIRSHQNSDGFSSGLSSAGIV